MARVGDLRALGVRLSIDDFGTGYSSLGYLQAFQVDELKLDRSFVSDPTEIGNPMVLSRAIVELARALGLEMVIEGVESVAQADWFASLGCSFAQGFYFARPLTPDNAERYLVRVRRPMALSEGDGSQSSIERRLARSASHSAARNLRLVSGEGDRA
jgi:EAL domain-containing protein (putative c-di-GMP-specific phosphodiesterase class I)